MTKTISLIAGVTLAVLGAGTAVGGVMASGVLADKVVENQAQYCTLGDGTIHVVAFPKKSPFGAKNEVELHARIADKNLDQPYGVVITPSRFAGMGYKKALSFVPDFGDDNYFYFDFGKYWRDVFEPMGARSLEEAALDGEGVSIELFSTNSSESDSYDVWTEAIWLTRSPCLTQLNFAAKEGSQPEIKTYEVGACSLSRAYAVSANLNIPGWTFGDDARFLDLSDQSEASKAIQNEVAAYDVEGRYEYALGSHGYAVWGGEVHEFTTRDIELTLGENLDLVLGLYHSESWGNGSDWTIDKARVFNANKKYYKYSYAQWASVTETALQLFYRGKSA